MNQPEFNQYESHLLESLNFHDYEQPVTNSIDNWYMASESWCNQLTYVRAAYNPTNRLKEEKKLSKTKIRYIRAFGEAATEIVRDSPIEELAVTTLGHEIRREEEKRLNGVRRYFTDPNSCDSTEEYFQDLTLAFADPYGETVVQNPDEPILSHDAAMELYGARLDEHEASVLGYSIRIDHRSKREIVLDKVKKIATEENIQKATFIGLGVAALIAGRRKRRR